MADGSAAAAAKKGIQRCDVCGYLKFGDLCVNRRCPSFEFEIKGKAIMRHGFSAMTARGFSAENRARNERLLSKDPAERDLAKRDYWRRMRNIGASSPNS